MSFWYIIQTGFRSTRAAPGVSCSGCFVHRDIVMPEQVWKSSSQWRETEMLQHPETFYTVLLLMTVWGRTTRGCDGQVSTSVYYFIHISYYFTPGKDRGGDYWVTFLIPSTNTTEPAYINRYKSLRCQTDNTSSDTAGPLANNPDLYKDSAVSVGWYWKASVTMNTFNWELFFFFFFVGVCPTVSRMHTHTLTVWGIQTNFSFMKVWISNPCEIYSCWQVSWLV